MLAGHRLFAFAAPLGGALVIGGWLFFMVAGLFSLARARKSD